MIEDRIIDDKISLKELIALAVCRGVLAGRGQIDYSRGAWQMAEDILNETEETLSHRERVFGIRQEVAELAAQFFGVEK